MMRYPPAYYSAPTALSPALGGDAGIDLPCSQATTIFPGEWKNIPCDVRIALPKGTFAFIMGRSSSFFTKHLLINMAVIDEGYQGDLFTAVYNIGTRQYDVEEGERISQLVILPRIVDDIDLIRVTALNGSTERGTAGFGSTG